MRSLNKATLIGNLTKDPELRYTPNGSAVCSFSIATNREWKDSTGAKKDEATFHRIVAWSKLAEIISQYVKKGSKVYVEGRLANRSWNDQQGNPRNVTEIVADELILLDSKRLDQGTQVAAAPVVDNAQLLPPEPEVVKKPTEGVVADVKKEDVKKDVNPDDIPF